MIDLRKHIVKIIKEVSFTYLINNDLIITKPLLTIEIYHITEGRLWVVVKHSSCIKYYDLSLYFDLIMK